MTDLETKSGGAVGGVDLAVLTEVTGVGGRVMRLSRLWDKEIKDFLGEHGLEPGEFDVLSTLRRSGEPYEATLAGLLESQGDTPARTGREP